MFTENMEKSTRDLTQERSFLLPLKENVSEIQEVKENRLLVLESGKGLDGNTGAKKQ